MVYPPPRRLPQRIARATSAEGKRISGESRVHFSVALVNAAPQVSPFHHRIKYRR
ncbi:hypothetical protein ETAE_1831 [Edwardsiella piscicida]|uniref:Uncharacterized protein n=1 Tax=Edwardsiella piscicida TaxID=1263550 RepID=A0AAU8P5K2_EDWPI|nr:hypothetical protein ETAE_1831 [Edwardsiella tarda EIB202]